MNDWLRERAREPSTWGALSRDLIYLGAAFAVVQAVKKEQR